MVQITDLILHSSIIEDIAKQLAEAVLSADNTERYNRRFTKSANNVPVEAEGENFRDECTYCLRFTANLEISGSYSPMSYDSPGFENIDYVHVNIHTKSAEMLRCDDQEGTQEKVPLSYEDIAMIEGDVEDELLNNSDSYGL